MRFEVLAVRTAHNEDATVYPAVTVAGRVAMEGLDGTNVRTATATAVAVGEVSGPGIQPLSRIGPLRTEVLVTDGRVVVSCPRHEKAAGGNTFGRGAGGTVDADDGPGAARRLGRRPRAVLTGHVRFPWLVQVGASPNHGVRGDEVLRLVLAEGAERQLALDLTFARTVDSLALAQEIVQRAARLRLKDMDDDDGDADAVRALTSVPRLVPEGKCFALYTLPTYANADKWASTSALSPSHR